MIVEFKIKYQKLIIKTTNQNEKGPFHRKATEHMEKSREYKKQKEVGDGTHSV